MKEKIAKSLSASEFKSLSNQVHITYADGDFRFVNNEGLNLRRLDWRSNQFVSLTDAIKILKLHVPSYNEFEPRLLLNLPLDVKVDIAREGSVCVYVQLPKSIKPNKNKLRCNECSCEDDKENIWRLWWD